METVTKDPTKRGRKREREGEGGRNGGQDMSAGVAAAAGTTCLGGRAAGSIT